MVWGDGFTDAEIPSTISTAMHDLIVGLLCFDEIYSYLTSVGQIHNLIGSRALIELIMSGSIKFVMMPTVDVVLYRDSTESNGMLNVSSSDEIEIRLMGRCDLHGSQS